MVGVCVVGWHSLVSGHSLCGHQLSFVFLSFFHEPDRRGKREREKAELFGRYLVDPASSHMLVLKIKPCMP